MKRALTEMEKKAIEIAKDIYQYHLGLVWQDIEMPFYENLMPYERELARAYIHLYSFFFAWVLQVPYEPQC